MSRRRRTAACGRSGIGCKLATPGRFVFFCPVSSQNFPPHLKFSAVFGQISFRKRITILPSGCFPAATKSKGEAGHSVVPSGRRLLLPCLMFVQ